MALVTVGFPFPFPLRVGDTTILRPCRKNMRIDDIEIRGMAAVQERRWRFEAYATNQPRRWNSGRVVAAIAHDGVKDVLEAKNISDRVPMGASFGVRLVTDGRPPREFGHEDGEARVIITFDNEVD